MPVIGNVIVGDMMLVLFVVARRALFDSSRSCYPPSFVRRKEVGQVFRGCEFEKEPRCIDVGAPNAVPGTSAVANRNCPSKRSPGIIPLVQ